MKKIYLTLLAFFPPLAFNAQDAYEIKVHVKGIKDSVCYLIKNKWDQMYFQDTAKVKNGSFTFTGKKPLEKGVYAVFRGNKTMTYFDLLIADEQKFSITTDTLDIYKNMKVTGSLLNSDFREFVIFMSTHYKDLFDFEKTVRSRKDKDSTKLIDAERLKTYGSITKFQEEYLEKNPANYLATIIRLQTDLKIPKIPLASNGRPDSIWRYNYCIRHYWDNIPLNDVGVLNTNKLFYNKLKAYFENTLIQDPDTLIKTIDRMMKQAGDEQNEMFKYMGFYFTYTVDRSKVVGHDAVFVDMVKKYYRTGKAHWYDDSTNKKIMARGNILEPLLIGKVMPDLDLVDTTGAKTLKRLGMDTITTSQRLTDVYMKNLSLIQNVLFPLKKVNADYTIVIFWDVDCGHCQKDLPKLKEAYDKMKKEGKNVEVYCVYTHFDVERWKKFIREHKFTWINVYDGVHFYDWKTKFDLNSTPLIYLLDKNKVIRSKKIGVEMVEEIIDRLIRTANVK